MKWLYWLVGIVVAIIVTWMLVFPRYTFRYEATVTVATPQGPKTGSSVIEVTWQSTGPLAGLSAGQPWDKSVRGIAPIIDLGDRGTLIAALKYHAPGSKSKTGLTRVGNHPINADAWPLSAYKRKIHELHSWLPPVEMERGFPQFVWVPPDAAGLGDAIPLLPDEFPKRIGAGFQLVSVKIQPTNDAVQSHVKSAPDWLKSLRNRYAPNAKPHYFHPNRFDFDLGQIETQFPPIFNEVK